MSHKLGLKIHAFLPLSLANGPGPRAVIWVQGCTLRCPGCFNPETHSSHGGEWLSIDDLTRRIISLGTRVEGITLTGGEPLQQFEGTLTLLWAVRQQTKLSSILFTGYTWDEVRGMPRSPELLQCVDVLITGRYRASERLAMGLRGSANKRIHFLTSRYTGVDIDAVPPAEVIVTSSGEVLLTGVDPVKLARR